MVLPDFRQRDGVVAIRKAIRDGPRFDTLGGVTMRSRVIAIALVSALTAPWAVACMALAPATHAMPCCPASAPDEPPTVRPCCAPADQQPATSVAVPFAAMHAPHATASVTPFGDRLANPFVESISKPAPSGVRPPPTVLLI